MRTRFPGYGFCIGTGYTGRKFRRNFEGPRWEEDVGGIEGLYRGMRAGNGWYGPGIGPGNTGGNLGRENA